MTMDQAHGPQGVDVRDQAAPVPAASIYETDFYGWAHQQAALLRAGRMADADIANIAEEIESLGRSERRELVSRLTVLLQHLLKWQHQPERRSKSWQLSIRNARIDFRKHLAENTSLATPARLDEAIEDAYRHALADAANETGLDIDVFPAACPWAHAESIADD